MQNSASILATSKHNKRWDVIVKLSATLRIDRQRSLAYATSYHYITHITIS